MTETSPYLWLVIAGGFVCFAMAWGIGANDVANAFATSVGARAITLKQAVIIAGIFEFAGAFFLGSTVTDTIRKKITDYDKFEGEEDVLLLGMFCALCASSLWLWLATKYSMPVSTTQSIIGSIIGFTILEKGPNAIDWESIQNIVLFWIVSPVLSGISAIIIFWPMRKFILRHSDSYRIVRLVWPLFVFIVVFIMTLFLFFKGLKRLDLDFEVPTAAWIATVVGTGFALISWVFAIKLGLLEKYVERKIEEDQKFDKKREEQFKKYKIRSISELEPVKQTSIVQNKNGEKINVNNQNNNGNISSKSNNNENIMVTVMSDGNTPKQSLKQPTPTPDGNRTPSPAPSIGEDQDQDNPSSRMSQVGLLSKSKRVSKVFTRGVDMDIHDDLEQYELEIQANAEQFDPKVERSFNWLQVASATLDIFAHGSNDVANSIAPFAAMVALYENPSIQSKVEIPWWILFLGAAGLVVGLGTYGYHIIKAIGVRLVNMSSTRGYAIECSSALIVIIASHYGYPASTTHTQVGSTVGIGLLEVFRPNSDLTLAKVVNWKLLSIVFIGWIFTIIVSAITSGIIFSILAYSPSALC